MAGQNHDKMSAPSSLLILSDRRRKTRKNLLVFSGRTANILKTLGRKILKVRRIIGVLVLLIAVGGFLAYRWKQNEPRRNCLTVLQSFRAALNSNNSESLLNAIILPQALLGRTVPEQTEFLRKALQDEISVEGLSVLGRQGRFGVLKEVFPAEGAVWARQAGVEVENCVAFKLEQNGLRTEAVLVKEGAGYRIVRCNNVKELMAAKF